MAMSSSDDKKNAKSIIIFSLVLAIVIAIGSWVYLIRTNKFFGLGELLRPRLKDIPVICNILPEVPVGTPPELMARDEINTKYLELFNENVELHKEIIDLNTRVNELSDVENKYKIVVKDLEKVSKQLTQLQASKAEDVKLSESNSEKVLNLVKIYESMEAQNAAKILEDVGELNIPLVVEICKGMKSTKFSEILQEMDTSFAAILSERMAE